MGQISIASLKDDEIKDASDVISKAFYTTPVVKAVFKGSGDLQLRQLKTGWERILTLSPGDVYTAIDGDAIVGVMRMVKWPECQMKPLQGLRMLPGMLISLRSVTPRLLKFRGIWAKHDPKVPHWHLDPLTVAPGRQGQGIGSGLLDHFCKICDKDDIAGYLETDQERNVSLYRRFGFSVIGNAPVFDVKTWFMWRKPITDRR